MGLRFPEDLRDEDAAHLSLLEGIPVRPVFIMGLHRSGTTWLYESLASVCRLAPVTLHHVFCYPRLLARAAEGRGLEDQVLIDRYFEEHGLSTRGIDAIGLSHATVEEYGWILQRWSGALTVTQRTRARFEELCRKLQFLRPDAPAVLLKNPWDTGGAPAIHAMFPDAPFVFIARDPLRIVQSQFQNSLIFGGTEAHFLHLLLQGFPLGRFVIGCQRLLYRLVGERLYARLILRFIQRDVLKELRRYRDAYAALPPERKLELTYTELATDPQGTLTRAAEFLGFPLDERALAEVTPRPRAGPLHPAVERIADGFRARVAAAGLARGDV
ncbi:MAG: sulfotransferase [Planctomycetota bacterium]